MNGCLSVQKTSNAFQIIYRYAVFEQHAPYRTALRTCPVLGRPSIFFIGVRVFSRS